jgi:hypothetical protein
MGCCRCCTTTGACCNGGVCTEETCADCEDAGGLFQGVGTTCEGEDSDECPCDPPANPSLCEKCDGVSAVGYCPEERPNCCDGTCQSDPCPTPCENNGDCPAGEQCCDGECATGYCHYSAQVVWDGEGVGDACPSGFQQSGLSELGKRICKTCDTEQQGECDEQAWWEGIDPGGDWSLDLNSLGGGGGCNPERTCSGVCDPDYPGSCCDGCECVEVDVDYYECQAEEPPP